MEIKTVEVVGFGPDDLAAPFELVVSIQNSDGENQNFIYRIDQLGQAHSSPVS